MKTKLFLVLFAIFALTIAAPVHGQTSYGTIPLLTGGTNNVASDATNTYSKIISAPYSDSIGLAVSFKAIAAGTSNVVFVFDKSLDGTTFPTATGNHLRWTVAANGTNSVGDTTNISIGAIGYLRLKAIESAQTNAITNITVTGSVKNRVLSR